MRFATSERMKLTQLFAGLVMIAACAKNGPKTSTLPGPQLGESTASPGSNPSKPGPVTPDDPRVMNTTAAISPGQVQNALQAPSPQGQTTATPAQGGTSSETVRAPVTQNPATSSTPVTQPADIAPPTSAPVGPQPGVFSPPPAPQQ